MVSNKEDLAILFWLRGANPLSNALLATGIYREMHSSKVRLFCCCRFHEWALCLMMKPLYHFEAKQKVNSFALTVLTKSQFCRWQDSDARVGEVRVCVVSEADICWRWIIALFHQRLSTVPAVVSSAQHCDWLHCNIAQSFVFPDCFTFAASLRRTQLGFWNRYVWKIVCSLY